MESPHCGKCNAPMLESEKECQSCGSKSTPQYNGTPVESEPGVFFCFRHKKEKTRLRCGRCARAICTRCAVIGSAGPRCPVCAKSHVPINLRGIAHDIKLRSRGLFRGPFQYLWILLAFTVITGVVRSCSYNTTQPIPEDYQEREPPPKN